ncbi:aspartyl-phosphate phosphatase Spo0E family protein [Paenibacillus dendritiformis]|uniref:Spo0E family sporulation regulatory protein-aspartic acid phosphatase n=1 Tax=Paenibacillus dendritiformis TaxID=130049 RepID=UPI00143D88B6|nr:aspartyl-phosphate phosphatase Spo0E family protein [Paenibacillus dendritiformis]NRF97530.1 aspartyl-phosphate phosphatase Spo0E family protein [Paenibacillus dendritiformis]
MCIYYSSSNDRLFKKIQQLRHKLVTIVNVKKNFTDDEVVSVSQELDSYLVEFQRKMYQEQADR